MKVIGVAGKAGTGKDTFALLAKQMFTNVQQLSFAAELKQEVSAFLKKCNVEFEERHLWGTQEDKEATLRISHHFANRNHPPMFDYLTQHGSYCLGWWYFQPRTLLQHWGSEFRRAQDPDYWVRKCLDQCTGDRIYIVTDVRFPNEADAIKAAGGILVRVRRKNAPSIANATHASETALDDYKGWDYTIINNATLERYAEIVAEIIAGELDEE